MPHYTRLFSLPFSRHLDDLLTGWSFHDISWLGKVAAIKITLLPKLLYLFRSLPLPLNKANLAQFQSKVLKFIWGPKGHRLAHATLYTLRIKGGLGVPDFWAYYKAAQLIQLSVVYSRREHPDWVNINKRSLPTLWIFFCGALLRPGLLLWCLPFLTNLGCGIRCALNRHWFWPVPLWTIYSITRLFLQAWRSEPSNGGQTKASTV